MKRKGVMRMGKKGALVKSDPIRPIPYWLAFQVFIDGTGVGVAKVTFELNAIRTAGLNVRLDHAALELLGRDRTVVPDGFTFKKSEDRDRIECEVVMPTFDFTIFDVAEEKQKAEEFFSKLVDEAERVFTLVKHWEKERKNPV
jgi:hypothetical protein